MRIRNILVIGLLASAMGASIPATANAESSLARAQPECEGFSTYTTVGEPIAVHVTHPTAGPVDSRQLNCSLMLGDRGAGVLILQWALNQCHNAGLRPDGIYGPHTRNVILWAQTSVGLDRDAIYGPITRRYLKWPLYDEGNYFYKCNYTAFLG